MIKPFIVIFTLLFTSVGIAKSQQKASKSSQKTNAKEIITTGAQDRAYWVDLLYKISAPVIFNLADGTLKKNMPVEVPPGAKPDFFKKVTYLEAVGRTMAGVAPWLALPDDQTNESKKRKKMRDALLIGIANAVNPEHPDYLNFRTENQPIVDAAYMAQAFMRAPQALWDPLDDLTKSRIKEEFKTLRTRTGAYNNWLLFAGINEAFLLSIGERADPARIEFAKRKIIEWYQGDGWYSDGPSLSIDYYNAYVIHPMLVDFFNILVKHKRVKKEDYDLAVKRMVRYSEFSERFIAPDGTYPPFGRSITYRTAAFQALGQVALMQQLPSYIAPAQVRCGLSAVMHRMFDQQQNFDQNGWLVLGFCGSQPEIADSYTSTGSLYMATLGFLPLGLPETDPFWTNPPEAWTSKKAWSGLPFKKDYHVEY